VTIETACGKPETSLRAISPANHEVASTLVEDFKLLSLTTFMPPKSRSVTRVSPLWITALGRRLNGRLRGVSLCLPSLTWNPAWCTSQMKISPRPVSARVSVE